MNSHNIPTAILSTFVPAIFFHPLRSDVRANAPFSFLLRAPSIRASIRWPGVRFLAVETERSSRFMERSASDRWRMFCRTNGENVPRDDSSSWLAGWERWGREGEERRGETRTFAGESACLINACFNFCWLFRQIIFVERILFHLSFIHFVAAL